MNWGRLVRRLSFQRFSILSIERPLAALNPRGCRWPLWVIALCSVLLFACEDEAETSPSETPMEEVDQATPSCEAETTRCGGDGERERCSEEGEWNSDPCDEGTVCEAGECVEPPPECEAGERSCRGAEELAVCSEEGAWEVFPCSACEEGDEGAVCPDAICVPGARICNGADEVVECNPAGSGFGLLERCQGQRTGRQCDRGECVPLCILNEKVRTNIGCDYWAVDLDNAFVQGRQGFLDAAAAPFAVVVSNPHPEYTGEVTVYNNEEQVEQVNLPPLGLHIFNLPRRDVDGTTLAPLAYRIRSSIPIVAYQFNPLENEDVYSNDASLLLPSHVLGDEYLIMTREQSFEQLRGYLTVVGISEEPTTVEVEVTAPTQAGVELPALESGERFEVTLRAFDVLNLQTRAPGADLTGSRVKASGNVVVFGGSEAANVPNTNHCIEIDPVTGRGSCEADEDVSCRTNYDCNFALLNTCCADHIEQQLFPVKTWGLTYIATKSFDRGLERDYWRILASEDNTKVETVPPQEEVPTLNAGEWFEFGSREHFEIISDKPILVGQFLAGEDAPEPNVRGNQQPGDAGTGDPAFILAVPTEQFREDFVFLAPDKYAFDYVSVIAPLEANVFFDDLPIPAEWEPVGMSGWQVARFPISDGVHFLIADLPVGVIVYGYDDYVSYGYPGGLNLNVVNPETGGAVDPPPNPERGVAPEDMGAAQADMGSAPADQGVNPADAGGGE